MVIVGCQFLIGVVFVAAVLGKVTGYPAFVDSVADMGFKPAAPIAALVLLGEVAVVALLVGVPVAGFALAALLLLAFAVGIVLSLRRGNSRPCRCFGRSTTALGRQHVWRNVFLIAVALLGALTGPAPAGPAVAVLAAVTGLVVGGLIVLLDDLRFLLA
jgi:uncharacterized membrane protein YphA (DoxX/SURF4 family)